MSHVDVSPARQQSSRGGCPADPVCPPTARRYAALDEEILSEEEGGADEEEYELQDHYASDELATTLAACGFSEASPSTSSLYSSTPLEGSPSQRTL